MKASLLITHLVLGVTALTLAACGNTGSTANQASLAQGAQTSGIIGGQTVSASDPIASTIVSIIAQYPVPGDATKVQTALCTGSILRPNIIITAAHCVYGLKPASVHVLFGTDVSQAFGGGSVSPDSYRNATQLVVHGFYSRNQDAAKNFDDIALVAFEGTLPAGYHPAAILGDTSSLTDGMKILLAGYGITNGNPAPNDNAGAGVLREVVVPIKTAAWSQHEVLFDQTATPTQGACHGDSGGPAYASVNGQTLLFGVTSRGVINPVDGDGASSTDTTPDYCNHYAAYTNILAYKSWINKKISQITANQQTPDDDGGASTDPTSQFGPHRKAF